MSTDNTALALLREIYDDVVQGAIPNTDDPWWAAASAALAAPAQAAALIKARKCDYCSREVVASVTTCICGSTEFGIQAALTHAGEYPPLDKGSLWRDKTSIRGYGADPGPGPWYTTEDVHRAIDDACAARETAKAAGVHPSIIETLQALAGEVDAGWTDDAKTALRKLQTLTAMHGAAQAAPVAPAKINRYCPAEMCLSTDPEHEPNCSNAAPKAKPAAPAEGAVDAALLKARTALGSCTSSGYKDVDGDFFPGVSF